MKMMMIVCLVAAAFFVSAAPLFAVGVKEEVDPVSMYVSSANTGFGYSIAETLSNPPFFNSGAGGRNAGSVAEHRAADFLAEQMRAIGLQNVTKDEFSLNSWQFNGASLTIQSPGGESRVIKPYSYASGGTEKSGITAELLYLGKGTAADYEGVDASGKIVLIDLNQWDDWWVTWPTLEAANQGAAAIINFCTGGYAQFNADTMNAQDFCGPVSIPSVNVSKNDADYLKGLLEKGPVIVNLVVDNVVKKEGTAYNITGTIPGRSDEMIVIGDHYDVHYRGFQDNNCAVGLTLAIAKGLIDSGYKPERTLVFVLHAAEEWGAIDTRYDWSIGAWNQVFRIHPEWSGKTLAYLNFELPAYEHGASTSVASTPEYWSFLKGFIARGPKPLNCFPEGIRDEGEPLYTWSDDFSYSIAGIPAMVNGFLFDKDRERYPFYENIYHSDFDVPDTYNADVFAFNLNFYGALAIALDKVLLAPLDFGRQARRLLDSVDESAFALAEVDASYLVREMEAFKASADTAYAAVLAINERFDGLVQSGAPAAVLDSVRMAARGVNAAMLSAYKTLQDELVRLTWADEPIFPHEHAQANIMLLSESLDNLRMGNLAYPVDELLWQIEDEWYSYSFSREVVDYMTEQVTADWNKNNLYWGTGRVTGVVDLYDVIRSLLSKYEEETPDLAGECEAISKVLASQHDLLRGTAERESEGIRKVREKLEGLDLSALETVLDRVR